MVDLLVVVAHPDDEVFVAGLLARMVSDGKHVAVITLTLGKAGRTLGLCNQDKLSQVRENEFRAALGMLGVNNVYTFNYPDFVIASDRGLLAHIGLRADFRDAAFDLTSLIEELMPNTVITFPPNGLNGHPDHVITHQIVHNALELAYWQPGHLYYFATSTLYVESPKPGFLSSRELRNLSLPPTHLVRIGTHFENKLRAMACHKTQALSILSLLGQFPGILQIELLSCALTSKVRADVLQSFTETMAEKSSGTLSQETPSLALPLAREFALTGDT